VKTVHSQVTEEQTAAPHSKWRHPIVLFCQWWATVFILTGPLAICPFCGQPSCGGSAVSAGVLGGLVATLTFVPRQIYRLFKGCLQEEKPTL